jgi:Arc/MetJ-type ribon-helix-helix transcriptional regulator
MATVTISLPDLIAKKVDLEAKKQGFATRSEYIRSLLRSHFAADTEKELEFKQFQPKPLEKIKADLEKTGKYNKKFINSLMKGLSESSLYADQTSK